MTRTARFSVMALALIGAAWALLALPTEAEQTLLAIPFESFPTSLRGWTGSNHTPTDVIAPDVRARERLVRTYRNGSDTVWVAVDYYPTQAEGHRPLALGLLVPDRGWSTLTTRSVEIPLAGGDRRSIPANVLLMRTSERQVATVYWYQIGPRSIASDHWYRAVLLYSRLVRRRTDGALVRITSPVPDGVDPQVVTARQMEFVRVFYPELLWSLPR